jgi:hypothetical protein
MPSLFSNEYSRGPLYQYWKERAAEEKDLRDQRISEASLRSKGFTPLDPAYGPSSQQSYSSRQARGPPSYEAAPSTVPPGVAPGPAIPDGDTPQTAQDDDLPAYSSSSGPAVREEPDRLPSAEEEKARLQRLQEQHRQTQDDGALAQRLSNEEAETQKEDDDDQDKGKQPERRKSAVGKVSRWLADAASGYTKKQERW